MELQGLANQLDWRALLDIVLVTFLVYQLLAMLKGTRAAQILIGLFLVFVLYAVSSFLQLETINWIVGKLYSSLIIILIVLFQDDIRRMLTRIGSGPFASRLESESGLRVIEEVISAAKNLSHDRLGAIVVFERGVNLERLHDYGIRVDSLVSEELLICIFQSFSPLHDGAVIVRNNRLSAASTQLPLSKNPDLTKKIGTRHSASLGISEETDAVALVVSEETGHISIACDGELYRQASSEAARRMLIQLLLPTQKITRWKLLWRRLTGQKQQWSKVRNEFVKRRKKTKTLFSSERVGASADPKNRPTVESLAIRLPRKDGVQVEELTGNGLVVSHEDFNVTNVHESEAEENLETSVSEDGVYKQSQALRSISDLSPDDKFIPPSVPVTGVPLDVPVGGASLNPPIEKSEARPTEGTEKSNKQKEDV